MNGLAAMTKYELRAVLGQNIRAERRSRGLTIDELSEVMDITPSHMGLIERGERGVTAHNLFRFSRVFGLPIDCLFHHEEAEVPSGVKVLQQKLSVLTSSFTERELSFVITVVYGMRKSQLLA